MNDDKLDTSMCMAAFEHVRRLGKFTITYYPAPPTHTNPNWKNQTIWIVDCLDIMRGMNSQSVDLIYLDPPFNSKANYAAPIEKLPHRRFWPSARTRLLTTYIRVSSESLCMLHGGNVCSLLQTTTSSRTRVVHHSHRQTPGGDTTEMPLLSHSQFLSHRIAQPPYT